MSSGEVAATTDKAFNAAYQKVTGCKNPSQQRLSWKNGKGIHDSTIELIAIKVFGLKSLQEFWNGPKGTRRLDEKIRRIVNKLHNSDQMLMVGSLLWPFLSEVACRPLDGMSIEEMFGVASKHLLSKRSKLSLIECATLCLVLGISPYSLPWPNEVSEIVALALDKAGAERVIGISKLDQWLAANSSYYDLTDFEARKPYERSACERLADAHLDDLQLQTRVQQKRHRLALLIHDKNEQLRSAIDYQNIHAIEAAHTALHTLICDGQHVEAIFREVFRKTSRSVLTSPFIQKLWLGQHDRLVLLLSQRTLRLYDLQDWFAKEWILCAVSYVLQRAAA